jgi:hypothetical protein
MPAMPKDLFCIPTAKKVVSAGPDWIHEVNNGSSETSGNAGHLGPDLKGVSSGLT